MMKRTFAMLTPLAASEFEQVVCCELLATTTQSSMSSAISLSTL